MGAVFGEYNNWITRKAENLQKIKAAQSAIATAKKQEAKDLEGTREGILHDTKEKIANDIAHIQNAKTDQERAKWSEQLANDTSELRQLNDAVDEDINPDNISLTKEDIADLDGRNGTTAMRVAENKIYELKQKFGDKKVESYIIPNFAIDFTALAHIIELIAF